MRLGVNGRKRVIIKTDDNKANTDDHSPVLSVGCLSETQRLRPDRTLQERWTRRHCRGMGSTGSKDGKLHRVSFNTSSFLQWLLLAFVRKRVERLDLTVIREVLYLGFAINRN